MCKWVASDQPRVLPGRHDADCPGEACGGCLPCTEPHCSVCRRVHVEGRTCAECKATTREALHDVARMCAALPAEVEHRGTEGEAMMLLGPAADPEAIGHMEASVLAGRVPPDYLEHANHELHPLFVLGSWDAVWRDALEHGEPMERNARGKLVPVRVTIAGAVTYIDQQLTYMADHEHVPFEDFARDVRRCRTHMESVLHDGEQVDRGAPCMTCNVPLERTWGKDESADGWRCPRCRQTSTEDQYRFAIAHLHRDSAAWLTDRDMEIRTGVKAGTVRVWAQRGDVERKRDQGRTVYAVADVERRVKRSA